MSKKHRSRTTPGTLPIVHNGPLEPTVPLPEQTNPKKQPDMSSSLPSLTPSKEPVANEQSGQPTRLANSPADTEPAHPPGDYRPTQAKRTDPPRSVADAEHPEILETLNELTDDTHIRYDTLDQKLQQALENQERLVQQQQEVSLRIESIREEARASRLVFAHSISNAREILAAEQLPLAITSGLVTDRSTGPATAPAHNLDHDVVSYADPTSPEETKYSLFRPRDADERTQAYKARQGKQGYRLAQEHYERGVRERNAHAEKLWSGIESKGVPTPPHITTGELMDPYEPDSGDDLVSPPPGSNMGIGGTPPALNTPPYPPRRNDGHGGPGGPPKGPPGGGITPSPYDDDDSSSSMTQPMARSPPLGQPHRRRDRPPHERATTDNVGAPAEAHLRRTTEYDRFGVTREHTPAYLRHSDADLRTSRAEEDLPNGEYARKQMEMIRLAIRERVTRELPVQPPMKNLKNIPSPDKYNGEDDADVFMAWLKAFLRWLALGRIVGPDLDIDRVQLLGQHLIKDARQWYDDTIDSFDGVGRLWSFEQSMCALYRRFIHRSTARSAADKFQHVRYKRETGVLGLWDAMVALTRKMPEAPDEYSFKVRFLDALPEEICASMLRYRDVSIERSTAWELRTVARLQEENIRALEDWRTSHRSSPGREGDRTRTPTTLTTRPPPRAGTSSDALRPTSTGTRTFVPNRAYTDARPSTLRTVHAPAGTSGTLRPPIATPRPAAPVVPAGIQCYNCKGYGHISSNCPKAQNPRLRAVRVLDDASDTPDDNVPAVLVADPEGTADPDGRTAELDAPEVIDDHPIYESDDEFYDVEGSQYDADADAAAAYSDHGNEEVWFGSMRIVAAAADDLPADEGDLIPVTGPANTHMVITGHPVTHHTLPMGSVTTGNVMSMFYADNVVVQGEPRNIREMEAVVLAHIEAMRREREGDPDDVSDMPELSDVVINPEDYDDTPALARLSDYTDPTRRLREVPLAELPNSRRTWSFMPSPANYEGPVVELPLDADLDEAWAHFVDSERNDDDITHILTVLYRMVHQNDHVLRELYSARTQADALRASLGWTRRELAIALFHESEGLTPAHRNQSATERQRRRIRYQLLTETDPLAVSDSDEELDERSRTLTLEEANHALLCVIDGRDAPAGSGLEPPDYDRVCRSEARFFAMTVTPSEGLVTRARAGRRPLLANGEQECIVLLLTINGLGALTLCDAGSTTEMLSNDFARVSECDILKLDNPATLQLGCAGSRSRINFGTRAPVTLGLFGADVYFDIANLDRYDAVLGTPFLRRFGVILDFKTNCVRIDGHAYPSLSRAQVAHVLKTRGSGPQARERSTASNVRTAPPTPAPSQ